MVESKNDFTKGSMLRNIVNMAVPMTVAQIINVSYNIVDRMYLGRLPGHLALTGVGLCLPIISIITGFANLCGSGGAPLCSIYRGTGEDKEAERILGNSFALLLLFGTIITVLCFLFRSPVLYLFGASNDTYPFANDYLTIYTFGTIFVMISIGMNPFINSQGFGSVGMLTVALGAAVNIVLDPIFIFVLNLGVTGAAIATVISQCCSATWVLKFLTGKRAILQLRISAMPLKWQRVKRILGLGTSGLMMNLTNGLVQVLCNGRLQYYGGDLYVGVMTVINSVREVISLPVLGITHASQPVLGFNYGAREFTRVRQGIRFTAIVTLLYSVVAWAIAMIWPEQLIRIFNNESELIEVGILAFRIYFSAFFFMSFQFIGQAVFVGLGKSNNAVFFSLFRKVFIVSPLILLLPRIGLGINGVFLSEPISNIVGGTACVLTMYIMVYRPLGKGEKHSI